jgi:hypothetical protein
MKTFFTLAVFFALFYGATVNAQTISTPIKYNDVKYGTTVVVKRSFPVNLGDCQRNFSEYGCSVRDNALYFRQGEESLAQNTAEQITFNDLVGDAKISFRAYIDRTGYYIAMICMVGTQPCTSSSWNTYLPSLQKFVLKYPKLEVPVLVTIPYATSTPFPSPSAVPY